MLKVDGDAPLLPIVLRRGGCAVPVFADDVSASDDVLVAPVDAAAKPTVEEHLTKLGLLREESARGGGESASA